MKTRTLENIVVGSLMNALAIFIVIWHYWVGPMPNYVLGTATVPLVVAMFGVARRRWVRKEQV